MARIAYVDHSYHQTTRSTLFLPELLSSRGHNVDVFWDDSWKGGEPIKWEEVCRHDVVVMFQSACPIRAQSFRSVHPNVTYIPMFDQIGLGPGSPDPKVFWKPFRGSKILSFSSAVHTLALGFGMVSRLARYYPDARLSQASAPNGLHGFFWPRRGAELGWNVIQRLTAGTQFDSFHLHLAGDPGFPQGKLPERAQLERYNVTTSTWFERHSDFEEVLSRANLYFAPRLAEGIGQSFLEAMALGQCVVAPDNPTMNEYLVHGVNGLLYDPNRPRPLDFSAAVDLGLHARAGIEAGRERWLTAEDDLADFILTPSATLYRRAAYASSRSRVTYAVRAAAGRVKAKLPRRRYE
jgi:Glycosyl transferases group 1